MDMLPSTAVKIGEWWFPFDDGKCRRHFTDRGLQMDHLDKALEYVTDWSLAVDGGAHVGSWARAMAARFGRVYAYEMAPDTYSCLEKNLEGLGNITARPQALGHKRTKTGVTDVKHTLGRGVGKGDQIQMVRLDDENLDSLGFLKLDLEGYEYFGLKGAQKTIEKFRPVILVEEKGHGTRYGLPADATMKFLRMLGYRHVVRIKPDNIFVPEPVKKMFLIGRKIGWGLTKRF